MAKKYVDPDDDFENIRPGDIDEIFGYDEEYYSSDVDDDEYEQDIDDYYSSEEDDIVCDSSPNDSNEETDKNYKEFDLNESLQEKVETDEYLAENIESRDDVCDDIDNCSNTNDYNDNNIENSDAHSFNEIKKEENKEEIEQYEDMEGEDVGDNNSGIHSIDNIESMEGRTQISDIEEKQIIGDNENGSINGIRDIHSGSSDIDYDQVGVSGIQEDIREFQIEEKGEENVNNDTIDNSGNIRNGDTLETDEVREEVISGSSRSIQIEEENTDQNVDELNDIQLQFVDKINQVYNKYSEDELIEIINKYDNPIYRNRVKELYIKEYLTYAEHVDFEDPNSTVKNHFWVYIVALFKEMMEKDVIVNSETILDSKIMDNLLPGTNPDLKADTAVEEIIKNRKEENKKRVEYQLDRTIFEIADDEDEENSSIFDDKRTLDKDFEDSIFKKIHEEVMQSDRMFDMSKVQAKVTINRETAYIPIIDYNTGVRLICFDTNDKDQYHMNALLISRKIPFQFNKKQGFKVRMLYSDVCKNHAIATISALKKLIGFRFMKDRYKVQLSQNYVIAYTTENKYVEMFEKGDPDSRKPENSTYYSPKPMNMALGIIVLDKKTALDRQSIRRTQIRRDTGHKIDVSVDDYDIQFVLSAHVVRNDQRLKDPAFIKENRYVEYMITQYTECNSAVIMDGLQVITACIIKEHMSTYDPGTKYAISFEYDRDNLTSPSVISMLDSGDGIEPSMLKRTNPFDVHSTFILPPSRAQMSGVADFEYGRMDYRFFSPKSIRRKYDAPLWNRYNLDTKEGRNDFIRSRGFEEFISPAPVLFDILPFSLIQLENSLLIRDIQKISLPTLSDRNSEDTTKLLYQQRELEYMKSAGSETGSLSRFLFKVADFLIDTMGSVK